jgi:hypothetical protein
MLRTALASMCILLLIATGYLTLSLVVLSPPRANLPVWFALAAAFTWQSALTLAAMGMPQPSPWLRGFVAAGACVLIVIAAWRMRDTLINSHFEGYNLLLGAMLLVQSALTLGAFVPR